VSSSQSLSCELTNGLLKIAETTVISAENPLVFLNLDKNVVLTFFRGHFGNIKDAVDF
jgi:hypothetical protein